MKVHYMSKVDELIAKLEGLKIGHNTCEDCWYSCPKSEKGCCDDRQEGCNCGADNHNAEIDSLITWVRSNIACAGLATPSAMDEGLAQNANQ